MENSLMVFPNMKLFVNWLKCLKIGDSYFVLMI